MRGSSGGIWPAPPPCASACRPRNACRTDVGALVKGFPRPASTTVDVGGGRTNFRSPDVFSIALGGGTKIAGDGDSLTIGPRSVGYRIRDAALAEAKTEATEKAIAAGAHPDRIECLDQEDVPLAYLPGNAPRIWLKVVGSMDGRACGDRSHRRRP